MGGGLARQLADQYSKLENTYSGWCKDFNNNYDKLKGKIPVYAVPGKMIANMFSQKLNFDTDYKAMRRALDKIKVFARLNDYTIAIPYKIGCGIAHGDWNIVQKIIEKVFSDYDITIYKLKED